MEFVKRKLLVLMENWKLRLREQNQDEDSIQELTTMITAVEHLVELAHQWFAAMEFVNRKLLVQMEKWNLRPSIRESMMTIWVQMSIDQLLACQLSLTYFNRSHSLLSYISRYHSLEPAQTPEEESAQEFLSMKMERLSLKLKLMVLMAKLRRTKPPETANVISEMPWKWEK